MSLTDPGIDPWITELPEQESLQLLASGELELLLSDRSGTTGRARLSGIRESDLMHDPFSTFHLGLMADASAVDTRPCASLPFGMTRQLVVTQHITLDGVVTNDGNWFDPTEESERGRELARITAEQASASDAFLVGRVTFEEMRGFWPKQKDDTTGVTDHLNRVRKYVVSGSLTDPGWDGTTVLRGGKDLEREIRSLTEAPGKDIVLTGSILLANDLLRLDLVHELRLFVHPVVLGRGRRLFPDGWTAPAMQLLESLQIHDVLLLRYRLGVRDLPATTAPR